MVESILPLHFLESISTFVQWVLYVEYTVRWGLQYRRRHKIAPYHIYSTPPLSSLYTWRGGYSFGWQCLRLRLHIPIHIPIRIDIHIPIRFDHILSIFYFGCWQTLLATSSPLHLDRCHYSRILCGSSIVDANTIIMPLHQDIYCPAHPPRHSWKRKSEHDTGFGIILVALLLFWVKGKAVVRCYWWWWWWWWRSWVIVTVIVVLY